jgi:hypothetical protein
VNAFSLQRLSYPKYVHCVDALKSAALSCSAWSRTGGRRHELV